VRPRGGVIITSERDYRAHEAEAEANYMKPNRQSQGQKLASCIGEILCYSCFRLLIFVVYIRQINCVARIVRSVHCMCVSVSSYG